MIYGYARVSTTAQAQNGNSLADQETKLREAGAQVIFSDAFTGKTMQRPEFSKLISALQRGDTLIVTKLDRFARTAAEGAQTVQDLLSKGVTVDILNLGKADNTSMGKCIYQIFLAFAELEKNLIVERTQAGRKIAMESGQIMGRPVKFSPERISCAVRLLEEGKTYTQVEKMTGISKSTLIRHRKKLKEGLK